MKTPKEEAIELLRKFNRRVENDNESEANFLRWLYNDFKMKASFVVHDADNSPDPCAALRAQNEELIAALKEIQKIGKSGVLERRETGKPTWHLNEAVAEIARAILAKYGKE